MPLTWKSFITLKETKPPSNCMLRRPQEHIIYHVPPIFGK